MGGGSTRSRQTTTTNLPGGQQRNVDALLSGALNYFNSGGREFFPGDLVADFNPMQTTGQNMVADFAGGAGQDLVSRAIAANDVFMDPNNIFNPDRMPGFNGVVDNVTRNITRNLTENILPTIRGGGTSSGQFGGSASGIGQALAGARTSEDLNDTLESLYMGAYGQGLNMFNNSINRAPALFGLGALPGQLTAGIGDARQQQDQREIQADVARHEFDQNEPIFLLNMLRELTGQAGTFGGTTTTNAEQKTSSSPVNQALGGALSLASMWNPMTSIFAGLPAAAGGALGGGGLTGYDPFAAMFPQIMGGGQ